ncbi:MAG: polysaccharide biosynthesis C-terminal domain-containing protein [Lachnospiraceae bacterium]|nr:polysaccharide biosynthesis C-terminal domain-containing protein [Lachnospiraceae bacterium]
MAGAGIYSTQFVGKGDYEGVRYITRMKLLFSLVITLFTIALLLIFGRTFIGLYIAEGTSPADRAATLSYAWQYLCIMLIGLVPFMLSQSYASALRECGQTMLPMVAGMTAMVINFIFNALLIFGLLGFPKLGVAGAAIATVISRFAEMLIIMLRSHHSTDKYPFFKGLYRPFSIPGFLFPPVVKKMLPLLCSEFLWSFGQAVLLQCYSFRGIDVVAAMNITSTVSQIFMEVFISLGNATAILIGQQLGAGELVSARRTAWRMMVTSVTSCLIMGGLLCLSAPVIPRLYNTEPEIRSLATSLIIVVGVTMFCQAIANVSYFTLRAGGKTWITFAFDAGFSWFVAVPIAFVLSHYSTLSMPLVYLCVSFLELLKGFIGMALVRQGSWVRNIVGG